MYFNKIKKNKNRNSMSLLQRRAKCTRFSCRRRWQTDDVNVSIQLKNSNFLIYKINKINLNGKNQKTKNSNISPNKITKIRLILFLNNLHFK